MAFTLAQLQTVEDAIAKGELRVRFADREVIYRSIDDLVKARDIISASLNHRPRQSVLVADTGFGSRRRLLGPDDLGSDG